MQPINPATVPISYSLTANPLHPPTPALPSHALCACALSLSSYNLFFCSVFSLVGLSNTSPALSTMEYYKRWRAEGGFVNGRRDVCQLIDQRAVGPLQMHREPPTPHPSPEPLPPPATIPPSRWMGSLRYQLCHHAGVRPNPPASCAFQNLKARLSYLMIQYDFFCCAFVACPLFFHPGSAKSMADELEKIRSGTNCV